MTTFQTEPTFHSNQAQGHTLNKEETELDYMVQALKQKRDEIRVQIHLGKQEARDEWERLEAKWFDLQSKLRYIRQASSKTAKGVLQIAQRIATEVEEGYKKMKESLRS